MEDTKACLRPIFYSLFCYLENLYAGVHMHLICTPADVTLVSMGMMEEEGSQSWNGFALVHISHIWCATLDLILDMVTGVKI